MDFLDAMGEDSPTSLRRAQRIAAPGSPAADYLTIRLGLARANGRTTAEPHELVRVGNGYDICVRASGTSNCLRVADFTGSARRVSGFTLEGAEIGDRQVVGDGTATNGEGIPVEAMLTGAFESVQSPYLVVVLTLQAPRDEPIRVRAAAYRSADGRQFPESRNFAGPLRLASGESGDYAFPVQAAQVGGELEVSLISLDGRTKGSVRVSLR